MDAAATGHGTTKSAAPRGASTILWLGLAATVLSVGATAITSNQFAPSLSSDAVSWILTYEFSVYGAGIAAWLVLALAARKGNHWVPAASSAVFIVGTALSLYNFTQPHPLAMSIAGLSPSVIGAIAVLILSPRRAR
ncbi:hypothetical protein [Haematomicrobium sanguinis]|uniref:hypothetical protein n=1 Tax=Haematomicrobium sanguinis TaxID=479106 RepID=UPI00047B2C7B|nr:hypothetical protein [Haematomicrobium sanguinis]